MENSLNLSQRSHWAGKQPISELMHQALLHPELLSLAAGFVDNSTLPCETTQAATEAILRDPTTGQAALQYGTTRGYAPLREIIADRFNARDNLNVEAEQIVVTAGSNQLLHLVTETLCDTGDIILCAAPTYFVYLGTLANLGVQAVGLKTDENGLIPSALESALEKLAAEGNLGKVKALYLVPYFDNPTTTTIPASRRGEIMEILGKYQGKGGIHLIEDAAYRELSYENTDVPSFATWDDPEQPRVIVAGTFSKSFSPGVRVGWGILPKHLVEPVLSQKGNMDFGSPNFSQHLLTKVFDLGLFEPHLERIHAGYAEKLTAMVEAAEACFGPIEGCSWSKPSGGLYVWLTLPVGLDAGIHSPLFSAAMEEGVLYVPGIFGYPSGSDLATKFASPASNTIRLSFGVQPPQGIRKGMAALARAVQRTLGEVSIKS